MPALPATGSNSWATFVVIAFVIRAHTHGQTGPLSVIRAADAAPPWLWPRVSDWLTNTCLALALVSASGMSQRQKREQQQEQEQEQEQAQAQDSHTAAAALIFCHHRLKLYRIFLKDIVSNNSNCSKEQQAVSCRPMPAPL